MPEPISRTSLGAKSLETSGKDGVRLESRAFGLMP